MRTFALTYPQLMNQAQDLGLDRESLVRLRKAHEIAEEMADGLYRAQGVPLLCHLVRTASIVLAEHQPLPVVLASLLHAAPLLHCFGGDEAREPQRALLEREIGPDAASLVWEYPRFPWHARARLEEHQRGADRYSDLERHLLVMRLANELEDHLDRAMAYSAGARARRRSVAYGAQAIELAERLGLPRLADELREAIGAAGCSEVPGAIVLGHRQGYARLARRWSARRAAKLVRSTLAQVREVARHEGLRGVFFHAIARLGYRRCGWFVRSLEPLSPAGESCPAVEIARLDAESFDEYLALRPGARLERFLERLEANNVCFAARHAGRLVSVTWAATGTVRLATGALGLEEDEVFIYNSFTEPAQRGRQVQTRILAHVVEHYRAAGYRRAVVLITPENRSSIRSRQRSGFRRTGTMHFLAIGPWQWRVLNGGRN